MDKKLLTLSLIALALAACAGAPADKFASTVSTAKDAGRPLVIYQLYLGRYANVGDGVPVTAGFINTSGREIDTVTLQLAAYSDGRPVLDDRGQVLTGTLAAQGDFTADGSYVATSSRQFAMRGGAEASDYVGCPKLTAISVNYKDGSMLQVEGDQARSYLSPALNASCAHEPRVRGNSLGH
jgi:hypothetical protein